MGKRKHPSEVTGPGTWVSPSKRTQAVKTIGKKKFTSMKVTAKAKREQKQNHGRMGPPPKKRSFGGGKGKKAGGKGKKH